MIKRVLFILAAAALIGLALSHARLLRLHAMVTFYDADKIVENFSNVDKSFLTADIPAGTQSDLQIANDQVQLPSSFDFDGKQYNVDEFLAHTSTTALVATKGGKVVFEQYYQGTEKNDRRNSFSMAKSFLSILVGIAVDNGDIPSLNIAITDYVPLLKGTAYDGATLEDVLEMSSGVAFDEDYGKFDSDINRMSRLLALGGSLDEFATSLQREVQPGERMLYVSIDTHVVGMVLRAATNDTIVNYFYNNLWQYIGGQFGGYYGTDSTGEPLVLGGLNLRSRDYARLGLLILNKGRWGQKQVVSSEWIERSITPQKEFLKPTTNTFGYSYQWWIPPGAKGEVMARGIYGQYIYINRLLDVVIVKNSADIGFMDDNRRSNFESLALFRAMATRIAINDLVNSRLQNSKATTQSFSFSVGDTEIHSTSSQDKLYELGGITKWFVALTLLDLFDENKLSLKTAVSDYLSGPQYNGLCTTESNSCFSNLTVEKLLNHTGGVLDLFDYSTSLKENAERYDAQKLYSPISIYQAARSLAQQPSRAPIDESFSYSHVGYLMLAEIIQKVGGKPWRESVKERVLTKAALDDTWFGTEITQDNRKRVVQGYAGGVAIESPYSLFEGSAEMLASSDQLEKFISWWGFSKHSVTQRANGYNDMSSIGKVGLAEPLQYGFGVMRYKNLVGHAGKTFGSSSYAGADKEGVRIIYLANDSDIAVLPMVTRLYDEYYQLKEKFPN